MVAGEAPMFVKFTAGKEVRKAIARIGRTEDVQFSPNGGRLAVAGFNKNRLLILGFEANWESEPPAIQLSDPLELESDALAQPHGLCWIDELTLIVANREGLATIFELPEAKSGKIRLSPVRIVGEEAPDLIYTPGSVFAAPVGIDLVEMLICNNHADYVSCHLLDRRDAFAPIASKILMCGDLALPDGVTISRSGRWIAVSDLGHKRVLIFRNDCELGRESSPKAVLKGVEHPHGVRFTSDERAVLVADASKPFVRLYRSEGAWEGDHEPANSIRVMSEESFTRGSRNGVGGPKGLDVTQEGRLMVISCLEEPLAFFDMRSILDLGEVPKPIDRTESEWVRETLLRYLSPHRAEVAEATGAIHRHSRLEIEKILYSRSYRFTAPLRWTRAKLGKVRAHWN